MKEVDVVCGIIFKNGKVFLARRKPSKSQGRKWEFPGGKVELNETKPSALKRELIEEFGMHVTIKERLGVNLHTYKKEKVKLIAYHCDFISAEFKLIDHDSYEWVEPHKIQDYNLAEADIPLLKFI